MVNFLPSTGLKLRMADNRRRWKRIRQLAGILYLASLVVLAALLIKISFRPFYFGYRVENTATALSFILSCYFGIWVWAWSWLSHVSGTETQDRLERSWPGWQIQFKHISEHLYEFRRELVSEHLAEVSRLDLMLSTLAYGIEDDSDPAGSIEQLAEALDDWTKEVCNAQGSHKDNVLDLGLWGKEEHLRIWSVKTGQWVQNNDVATVAAILRSMDRICKVFHYIKSHGTGRINLVVREVVSSDLRIFAIRRRSSGSFGMLVTLTPLTDNRMRKSYLHTGFITLSSFGCERLIKMSHLFSPMAASPAATSPLLNRETFLNHPEIYFEEFFELPAGWNTDPEGTARRICP